MQPTPRFLAAAALALAFGVSVPLSAQDCSFNPEQQRSPREIWHRLSQQAEVIAPSATSTGRRRAAVQPARSYVAKNFVDDEIFGKMVKDGVVWTVPAGDEEFLRRVHLDLTGQIPTAQQVKDFLADTRSDKRERTVDELLASEAFTDRWTIWFGDLVQNVQIAANFNMGPLGRNVYATFIRDSMRAGKPYDQMVREVLTASGSQLTVGPVNYWIRQVQTNGPIQDTWDNLSADSGEKFLGLPLVCISCHGGIGHLEQVNTGLVRKSREDFWKNAAFFATDIHRVNRDANDRPFLTVEPNPNQGRAQYQLNTTNGNKTPRQPLPNGTSTIQPAFILTGEQPAAGESRRVAYARILTAHPQFARATVNYIWKEIFGLGIVEPVDSFDLLRQDPATLLPGFTAQPTHPQLITRLAEHFSGSGFSLRTLLKTIVMSNAYQLSSAYTPGPWNELWTSYYARHYPRRILAESVVDAIGRATNVPPPRMNISGGMTVDRAIQLPDPTEPRGGVSTFISGFGRGDRDTTRRSNEGSIVQALSMMNDAYVVSRVRNSGNSTVQRVLAATRDPGTIADELYLATLSRKPTQAERSAAIGYLGSGDIVRKTEDLQFALLNRLEFLYN
jgi:hypothetical protein